MPLEPQQQPIVNYNPGDVDESPYYDLVGLLDVNFEYGGQLTGTSDTIEDGGQFFINTGDGSALAEVGATSLGDSGVAVIIGGSSDFDSTFTLTNGDGSHPLFKAGALDSPVGSMSVPGNATIWLFWTTALNYDGIIVGPSALFPDVS